MIRAFLNFIEIHPLVVADMREVRRTQTRSGIIASSTYGVNRSALGERS
jgi:hypothetical protein